MGGMEDPCRMGGPQPPPRSSTTGRGVAGAVREPTVAQIPPRPPVDLFGGFDAQQNPPQQQQQQPPPQQQSWNAFGNDDEFPADFGSSQTKQNFVANFDQDPFAQQAPNGPSGQPQQPFGQQQQQFGQPPNMAAQGQPFGQPTLPPQQQQQQPFGQSNIPTQGQQQQSFGQSNVPTQGQQQQPFGQPNVASQGPQQPFGQPNVQVQQQQANMPPQGQQQQFSQPNPQQQQFGQSNVPPQGQQQQFGQPNAPPQGQQQQFGQPNVQVQQQQPNMTPQAQQQQFGQSNPQQQQQQFGQSNVPQQGQQQQFGQPDLGQQQFGGQQSAPQQQNIPPPQLQSMQTSQNSHQFGNFGGPNQADQQTPMQNVPSEPQPDKFDAFNSIGAPSNDESNVAAAESDTTSGKVKNPRKYKEGQRVCYKSASYIGEAEILKVHLDDDLEPFYTIRVQGKEKQTDDGHLSSTMQEHVQSLIEGLTNEQLNQVQAFIATLTVSTETSPPVESTASVSGGSVSGSVAASAVNTTAGKVASASAPPTPQSAVTGASFGSTQQQPSAQQPSMPPLPQLNTPAAKSTDFSGIPSPEGGPNPSVGVVPYAAPQLSQPSTVQSGGLPSTSTMPHQQTGIQNPPTSTPGGPPNEAMPQAATMPTQQYGAAMPTNLGGANQGAVAPTSHQPPMPTHQHGMRQERQMPIPQQQWQQPAMVQNFPGQQNLQQQTPMNAIPNPQHPPQYTPQQQLFAGNQLGSNQQHQLQNSFSGIPSGSQGSSMPNHGQQAVPTQQGMMYPQMNGQMTMQGQLPGPQIHDNCSTSCQSWRCDSRNSGQPER